MTQIKICGVPEHFNFPWLQCIDESLFLNENLNVQWTNVPEGTGKMCELLRQNNTDIAIVLTEGIVKDIVQGNDSKIVQLFVESPLTWGIHVGAASKHSTILDLEHKKVAISRFGSGSHLMACVHAKLLGWNPNKLDFVVVNNLQGAIDALSQGDADYFLWEKLMTKPLVDSNVFRLVGEIPTPWPCFVIVVRSEFLEKNLEAVKKILEIINRKTTVFKSINTIEQQIAAKYNLKTKDVNRWLSTVSWSQKPFTAKMLSKVQNELLALHLVDKKLTFAEVTATL